MEIVSTSATFPKERSRKSFIFYSSRALAPMVKKLLEAIKGFPKI
ncbi:MAG: hypothetical protein QXF61_09265 [Nitrososphaeria archaeon]